MNIEVKPLPAGGTLLAEPPAIAHVGIVGAGQMGNGIAHVCALAGLDVTMLDVKPAALERAMATMTSWSSSGSRARPKYSRVRSKISFRRSRQLSSTIRGRRES